MKKKTLTRMELALIKKGKNVPWLAKELGVSHQSIYAWLSGKSKPSNANLFQASKILKTPLKDLLIDFYN